MSNGGLCISSCLNLLVIQVQSWYRLSVPATTDLRSVRTILQCWQVWTLVHTHGAAACVTAAAQQSSVFLTLPPAARFWRSLRHYTGCYTPPPIPKIARRGLHSAGFWIITLLHNFVSTAEITQDGYECQIVWSPETDVAVLTWYFHIHIDVLGIAGVSLYMNQTPNLAHNVLALYFFVLKNSLMIARRCRNT